MTLKPSTVTRMKTGLKVHVSQFFDAGYELNAAWLNNLKRLYLLYMQCCLHNSRFLRASSDCCFVFKYMYTKRSWLVGRKIFLLTVQKGTFSSKIVINFYEVKKIFIKNDPKKWVGP